MKIELQRFDSLMREPQDAENVKKHKLRRILKKILFQDDANIWGSHRWMLFDNKCENDPND